jgi:hypothetical protein
LSQGLQIAIPNTLIKEIGFELLSIFNICPYVRVFGPFLIGKILENGYFNHFINEYLNKFEKN